MNRLAELATVTTAAWNTQACPRCKDTGLIDPTTDFGFCNCETGCELWDLILPAVLEDLEKEVNKP